MNSTLKNLPSSELSRRVKSPMLNSTDRQTVNLAEGLQKLRRNSQTLRASSSSAQTTRAFSFRYRGNATTTIGQLDPSGRVISGTVRSSQTGVTGEVTDPRSAGGFRETNPFSLNIASSSAETVGLKEGAFTLNSALPFNFRGGFLLQYWNLQYSGDRISGRLNDTGTQYSLATNLVNVREPLAPSQLTMNRGTTFTGRVTQKSIQVRIQGTGVSLFSRQYAFVIDAVLAR
jgi:hypothetical protein